jgi:hypothetical protein
MARRKAAADNAAAEHVVTLAETLAANPPTVLASPPSPVPDAQARTGEPESRLPLPEPFELKQAKLGAAPDSPKIALLRSHRFNQMQIRADEPLPEKQQAMLREAGWTDRTEAEGIWTKQLPKGLDDAGNPRKKWRDTADAERLFTQIANDIRTEQKLGSVLSL